MTDEQTPGQRLDTALAQLDAALEQLRTTVGTAALNLADDVADRVRDAVATVSDRIDDVRAAWGHDDTEAPTE